MSTLSEAKKLLGSESESRVNWRAAGMVLGAFVMFALFGQMIVRGGQGRFPNDRPMPTPTMDPAAVAMLTPTMAVFALEPTDTPSAPAASGAEVGLYEAQIAAMETRIAELQITPTATPTPWIIQETVYIEVPVEVEVTREVEVLHIVEVTPTVVPLASGVVRVCVDAAGVRELYIDGHGVVGGGCRELFVGVGSTQIVLQINR